MPSRADTLRDYLESLHQDFKTERALERDPIRFVRRWPPGVDQEVVSLFAALLSYGRVETIAHSIESVVHRMGPSPAASIRRDDFKSAQERFAGFVHRVTRGSDVARVWLGPGALLRAYPTLGDALRALDDPTSADHRPMLIGLRRAIIEHTPQFAEQRSFAHFLSDPAKGSACKRYMMWLRWMVRGPDEVDLGVWSFLGTERLRMPLDTHVHRISQDLGLISRRSADWKTVEELTGALRRFNADDPVRFDFAIAHLGISGDVIGVEPMKRPSRRDEISR